MSVCAWLLACWPGAEIRKGNWIHKASPTDFTRFLCTNIHVFCASLARLMGCCFDLCLAHLHYGSTRNRIGITCVRTVRTIENIRIYQKSVNVNIKCVHVYERIHIHTEYGGCRTSRNTTTSIEVYMGCIKSITTINIYLMSGTEHEIAVAGVKCSSAIENSVKSRDEK